MYVATFRLQTPSLRQAIKSTGYAKPYKALCSAVIGWFSTAVVGTLQSSLVRWVVLSAVRFFAALLLLCMFLDLGHPCFWNFNSTIPVDVVRVKSYVNSLFDPACAPMRITINKLYLIPKRIVSGVYVLWACSETAEVWVRATWMSWSCSFILSLIGRISSIVAYTYKTQ